jgi:hypothetical protein
MSSIFVKVMFLKLLYLKEIYPSGDLHNAKNGIIKVSTVKTKQL